MKEFAEVKSEETVSGYQPRKGLASGMGSYEMPKPARTTVEFPRRYARPTRGANSLWLVEMFRPDGFEPTPPSATKLVAGSYCSMPPRPERVIIGYNS